MEKLIRQAFLHVDVIGAHVQEGHYDLVGPNGEIILPEVWETVLQPDWSITMHMWPMPEDEEKKKKEKAKKDAAAAAAAAAAAGPAPRESGRSVGLFGRRTSKRTARPLSVHGGVVPPAPPAVPNAPGVVLEDPEYVGPPPPPGVVVVPNSKKKKSKSSGPADSLLWLAGGGVRRRPN